MVQGSGGTTGMMLVTRPHWRGKECESLPSTDAGGQRTVPWTRGAATWATIPGSGFLALPARSPEAAALERPVQLRRTLL